ncbi:MAG TPA: acetyl-CoA carboxylase biotin carboxyl carrier protein subunit [Ktedonobacteraceae bacterium]|nr:acetyl-CoA carboxylase biotin carboxyl carrier protein subunit [Ktedonobacteraceae bacterium]
MDVKEGTHQTGRHKGTRESAFIAHGDEDPLHGDENEAAGVISIEQLQHLVQLLDRSDVSELEFRRPEEGLRLLLRKVKPSESNGLQVEAALVSQTIVTPTDNSLTVSNSLPTETKHSITSHLVGVFHVWAKPRGGALVAVGDHVKVGQLVATIESLNVINEVESSFAGRVVEIFVQEGQSVEYGQKLMTIDTSAKEEEQ